MSALAPEPVQEMAQVSNVSSIYVTVLDSSNLQLFALALQCPFQPAWGSATVSVKE